MVYCLCIYTASMFSGSWKESEENVVHIQILDPNITFDCKYILIGMMKLCDIQ